ncbi:MAG: hypothetical protein EP310_07450 [Bacteroidetes bacterium]|nr:MAG: hypothetical protein EP310_07450 [Bacteroidota bacterium]
MVKTLQKSISLILVISVLMTTCPLQSNAKWRDRSDELPGTVSDEAMLGVTIAGAVLIGGLIFIVVKGKKKLRTSAYKMQGQNFESGQVKSFVNSGHLQNHSLTYTQHRNTFEKLDAAARSVPVELVLKPVSSGNDMAFNTNGMQVGIRIRF